MLRFLVFFWVFSLMLVYEADSRRISLSRGLSRMGSNFLKRNKDASGVLNTAATASSVYVGGTGIWWRSGIIASINQLEQGKKEEAMETLNIAIATLTVFDTTQATVQPIASELIHQLVKHKGQFPETVKGLTNYNKALAERTIAGSADDADDIIDSANSFRKQIGNYFDTEVTAFMKNTQGYDDLVKSLNNAKKWAKAATWLDTLSGPLFDVANVAFCGWQLYNAIWDEDSPPDVRALNIASASLGVASGAVGVVSFVAGALATAGSTLAAFAGPVGALIGCVLGLASIIIDLINSSNPAGTIKEHLETIQALREGSLQYLENDVNLTQAMASKFNRNVGFDTVYQVNQGNLIMAMRTDAYKTIRGADSDSNVAFNIKSTPADEDGYLAMGKKRIFDKSKYANLLWSPEGTVPLGYDFYGKVVKPDGKGVTVFATTAMVAEQFWIRGIHVDTRLENDEAAPDNVIIGELSGLMESASNIRVYTGAGDDLLQVTGVTCNRWTKGGFQAELGSGVNTLSFQGMNPDRKKFPESPSNQDRYKIFAGITYSMHTDWGSLYFKLKESESSNEIKKFGIGEIKDVNVLYGKKTLLYFMVIDITLIRFSLLRWRRLNKGTNITEH
ncbi:uncharacterized protein LOC110234550 [Exaiptasia diaphana]|uniref:Uncharacterized protein n=1 Tax=Exaiptasia diaphana TaxID=2652724 RepID=A0A913WXD7_EXADI|nr:uncharacterized protein LOC110234550 [Exaiptasia diaphana]